MSRKAKIMVTVLWLIACGIAVIIVISGLSSGVSGDALDRFGMGATSGALGTVYNVRPVINSKLALAVAILALVSGIAAMALYWVSWLPPSWISLTLGTVALAVNLFVVVGSCVLLRRLSRGEEVQLSIDE